MHEPRKSAVIITGTSKGLGKEIALRLFNSGYTVFGTVRNEKDY